ncbi:hypothetical protein [Mycobacterium canetti]|uniref:hypothetical protein n=1 Tax=Mycobacterium canetti TaxID=78331 RepID=UPI001E44E518|nr:hypothetical protein [Mycobacterium canetti]
MLRILAMQAFDVMDAWGFDYKTYLVWVKPQIGMGNYFRVSTELVLFGAKGGMRTQARDVRNWFEAKRGKHSAKPTAAGVYGRARRAGAAGVACQPEGSTMTATWVTITDLVTGRRVTCRADAIEDTLLDDVLADRRLYAPAGAVAWALQEAFVAGRPTAEYDRRLQVTVKPAQRLGDPNASWVDAVRDHVGGAS